MDVEKGALQGNLFSVMSLKVSVHHWGRKALLLYGKVKTNNNALKRGILIHPVSLPNFSIYPLMIPVKAHKILGHKIRPYSEGCITIPFRKYEKVAQIVKSSSKPLMIWVYE